MTMLCCRGVFFSLGFVQLGSDWIDLEKWVLIAM